jgi:hypothetical protein
MRPYLEAFPNRDTAERENVDEASPCSQCQDEVDAVLEMAVWVLPERLWSY